MHRCVLLIVLLSGCYVIPETPVVELAPDNANTIRDLTAQLLNPLDEQTYVYAWFHDGERVTTISGPVLPASMTARDELWRVEVTGYSDGRASQTGFAELTIGNHAPEVAMVIAPTAPRAGDALVVAALVWDADQDANETTYRWFRDGELQGQYDSDQVPADVTRGGELWACEVYATETNPPQEQGPTNRAEVQIATGHPTITSASLLPAAPRTDDSLRVEPNIDAPQGLPVSVRYDWMINDVVVQSRKDASLSSELFNKGDKISVTVVVNDGGDEGDQRSVGPVIILNTPPGAPKVRVNPSYPVQAHKLQCQIVGAPDDADDDGITAYSFAWSYDGEPYTDASTTALKGDTIDAGVTLGDERWTCAAQASDGESWGAPASTSVEVLFPGFETSQVLGGRTLTCGTVTNTGSYSECNDMQVDAQNLANGVGCYKVWVTEQKDTYHDRLCQEITGSSTYWAHYQCAGSFVRATWNGSTWGSVTDSGFTQSLRCAW